MIPICRDEMSTRPAGTNFIPRLHVEIKFRPGKAGQFSTWHLFRFVCIFFELFFVSISLYELKTHRFPKMFCSSCLVFSTAVSILFHKIRSSRLQMIFKIGILKCFAIFSGKHKCWCLF